MPELKSSLSADNDYYGSARSLNRKELGQLGEQFALDYLLARGMLLVKRNWTSRIGEIDLLLSDRSCLVFVEVKSRATSRYAESYLFANISSQKKRKLRQLVNLYLRNNYRGIAAPEVRIDAVGVLICPLSRRAEKIIHKPAAV
ncbi:hypothetical protein BVY02_00710 [bacterium J17]|nr:hypothetical protein BVY02_00710 [bacterium J17]